MRRVGLSADAKPFVGRERDLVAVAELLRAHDTRLVTVIGPDGVGKTRLVSEVAAALSKDFVDGDAYVDVGSTPAPELVAPAIARVLEVTACAVTEAMRVAVADREVLLVLDDCGSDSATVVGELAEACDHTRLLATASGPLGIVGERVHALGPLDHGGFAGVPLAQEVGEALPADLRDGAPAPLHELLATAWRTLDAPLQMGLASLSVFAGGWTRESADAVCGGGVSDFLAELEERRMIARGVEAGRFSMHPAIREFAGERLESLEEAESAKRRLSEWILQRTEEGRLFVREGNAPAPEWRAELEAEANNVRAALVWAQANDADLLVRIVRGAWWCYRTTSQFEAKLWLDRALEACSPKETTLRGDLLEGATLIALETGDGRAGDALAQDTLALRREGDDDKRLRSALVLAGNAASAAGRYSTAVPLYAEAREASRGVGDVWGLCFSTYNLGDVLLAQGDLQGAEQMFEEALPLFEDAGKATMAAATRGMLGQVALRRHALDRAEQFFRETVVASQSSATRVELVIGLEGLAGVAAESGALERAGRLLGAADRVRELTGLPIQETERVIRDRVFAAIEAGADVEGPLAEGRALTDADAAVYALGHDG